MSREHVGTSRPIQESNSLPGTSSAPNQDSPRAGTSVQSCKTTSGSTTPDQPNRSGVITPVQPGPSRSRTPVQPRPSTSGVSTPMQPHPKACWHPCC